MKAKVTIRPQLRVLIFIGVIVAIFALAFLLAGAWRETQRREAYLPQLETEAYRHPQDGRLLALLGARLVQAGEFSEAAAALHRAINAGESNEAVWQTLAASLAASGQTSVAMTTLQEGIRHFPQGHTLQEAEERGQALGHSPPPILLARTLCPQGAQPLMDLYGSGSFMNGLAEWWGRRHPEESGFATRQDWAHQQPGDAQAQRLWGLALLKNRRLPEARSVLQNAVALAPDSPAAHLALADCLDLAHQPGDAVIEYAKSLRLRPNWLPALIGLGHTSVERGMTDDGIAACTRATQVEPGSAEGWIGLGRAYQASIDMTDKAVAAFGTAARLAPERMDFLYDYATVLEKAGRWEEAEAAARRYVAAMPEAADAHYLLGQLLMNANPTPQRLASAEAETRAAKQLMPQAPLTNIQLGTLLLEQGRATEAAASLQEALRGDPDNYNAALLLARALRQAGQPAQAVAVSRQAALLVQNQQKSLVLNELIQTRPLDAGLHQQLADMDTRLGKAQEAANERDLARLIRANPDHAAQVMQAYHTLVSDVLNP